MSHYKLNFQDEGRGAVIVLIHGMASSLRYWDDIATELVKNYRVIRFDLLGFGDSPKPKDVVYDYTIHTAAIVKQLQSLGVSNRTPITLVGHSMGALIAARLAANEVLTVQHLVLFGAPIYDSPADARTAITGGRRALTLAYYGPTSHLLCATWCTALRPLSKLLAPLYLRHVPRHVAQDSLLHTWQAYSQSLRYVIEEQTFGDDIGRLPVKPVIVYGDKDGGYSKIKFEAFKKKHKISLIVLEGTHQLPIEKPHECAAFITQK